MAVRLIHMLCVLFFIAPTASGSSAALPRPSEEWARNLTEKTLKTVTNTDLYQRMLTDLDASVRAASISEPDGTVSLRRSASGFRGPTDLLEAVHGSGDDLAISRLDLVRNRVVGNPYVVPQESGARVALYPFFSCVLPEERVCLIAKVFSDRRWKYFEEVDLFSGLSVEGGFRIDDSPLNPEWLDANTLMTFDGRSQFGLPFIVNIRRRGEAHVEEVFRGDNTASYVLAKAIRDSAFNVLGILIEAHYVGDRSAERTEVHFLTPVEGGYARRKIGDNVDFMGQVASDLIFTVGGAATTEGTNPGDVIGIDLGDLQRGYVKPRVIFRLTEIASGPDARISSAGTTRSAIVLTILDSGRSSIVSVVRKGLEWTIHEVLAADGLKHRIMDTSLFSNRVLIRQESFTQPPRILVLDALSGAGNEIAALGHTQGKGEYVTSRFTALSRDGWRVPYYVVSVRGLADNRARPTLMDVYGGFGAIIEPTYDEAVMQLWVSQGGTYVFADLRGDGTAGDSQHRKGSHELKQATFDDAAAVARDLVRRGLSSPNLLAIRGHSNGGLTAAVTALQNPDLFGAVVASHPLTNMTEFVVDNKTYVGEYGDPSDPVQRAYLLSYSPVHNVYCDRDYPPFLILTSANDDLAPAWHARQLAQALERCGEGPYYFETKQGRHGGGGREEQRQRQAVTFSFLWNELTKMCRVKGTERVTADTWCSTPEVE